MPNEILSLPQPSGLSFTIEPQELGKLLYLQVAPLKVKDKRRAAVAFRLRIQNNRKEDVTVSQFTVSFPKSKVPSREYTRTEKNLIKKGLHEDIYMEVKETIELSLPTPKQIQINVSFTGIDGVLSQKFELVPHKNPTPEGSYAFPFKPEDMKRDEYIHFGNHRDGGGQHFAYDIGAIGWNKDVNKFTSYKGSKSDTNESRFAWHKKVHAMADGVVLLRESGYPNNPVPGQNNIMRFADAGGGSVTAVAVEHLHKLTESDVSKAFMLTAVRTLSGMLKLIVFEQTQDAKTIKRKGEAVGDAIPDAVNSDLSLTVLDSNHAITAVTTGGVLTLTLWFVSEDGMTLKLLDKMLIPDVTAAKVARLSPTRIVTAVRTKNNTLMLSVWKIKDKTLDSFLPIPMGQIDSKEQVSLFDLAVLSNTRVVTVVKTKEFMKVIVWEMALINGNLATTITRGSDTGNVVAVTAFASSKTSVGNQVAVAARLVNGKLAVYYWNIDEKGVIKEAANITTTEDVSMVTMRQFKKTALLSAVTLATGALQLIVWTLEENKNGGFHVKMAAKTQKNAAGAPDRLSLASILTHHTTATTVVRDANGNLKVILWQIARSNRYIILHGDAKHGYESVLYAHMDDMGNLPQPLLNPGDTVKKGQWIGLLGNSGASGGPHLHIHALKVPAGPKGLSKADLKELINNTLDGFLDVAYRPIVFNNANAMMVSPDLANLKRGGIWKNPFSVMDDDGIYFNQYAMFPGPASELPVCGQLRKEIASLELEVTDLQKDLHTAGTGSQKAAIAKEVKKLKAEILALKAKLDELPCKD